MVQPHPSSHHDNPVQEEIQHGFLQRAVTLCQDTDYIVRINMCDALQTIAAAVGHELTVSTVLPEIFELIGDEEVLVRVCAMRSLLKGGTWHPAAQEAGCIAAAQPAVCCQSKGADSLACMWNTVEHGARHPAAAWTAQRAKMQEDSQLQRCS